MFYNAFYGTIVLYKYSFRKGILIIKTSKILRKILASSLAVAMIGSVAVATPVGSMIGADISVSAASASPVVTVGDFQYVLYSDGTAKAVGYTGTKNLSTTSVAMPTVVYASEVDSTWSYLQYNSSYTVTQLQASIFNGCIFKTLTLPSKLQTLTGGFTGAEIGGFFIDSNNSYFSSYYYSSSNALYNKSQTTLYAFPSDPSLYVSSYGTATRGFPSSLTRIEDQAFANSKLYTVTIPESVTYVGDRLFTGSNVTNVEFQGNAPTFRFMPGSTVPDHGTFEGASNLFSIKIDGKDGAYNTDSYGVVYNKDMTKLVLVPQGRASSFNIADTCTEIGDYAFYKSNAKGPVIYDQVKTIGTYAFSGVKSDFKVYCLKDTPTDTIVQNRSIPYTYIYEYTTSDDGVTITKYNGPYNSPGVLKSINGKDVIAIGNEAFRGNTSLTAVYLYSPISSIGDYAFSGCSNITRVSMPSTVTTIGDRAFYGCSKMTSVSLPSRLTKIGGYGFGYCTGLTSVTIPNSVTQLNYSAFYGCSGLTDVKLGTGLKTIGSYAFENTGLTTQYIPKNVTAIGSYAFGYTYSDSTHTRNTDFESISGYPDSKAETYANNNDITFNSVLTYSVSDGEVAIEKYTGTDTSVVIPESIGGKPVTKIKSYAFNGSGVVSVTLPSSMTQLNGYAFYGASKLTTVSIPSSITSIGSYAFEFCTSLKSIAIPATVKSIGTGAFYGCTALSSVSLFNGLTSIGKNAFTNVALTSVTVPKTVTSIAEHAFGYKYEDSTYTGVSSFKMTGYVDTAAETYALANTHITFNPQYETFSNTSTIDKTSIVLGSTINVTASATGGKKPYTYAVYYKKGSDAYTTLQTFSTNTKVSFTPASSGTYTVMVTAADYRNVTASKTFTVTVAAPQLFNDSSISSFLIESGESITVTGKASGGEPSYRYAVFVKSGADDSSSGYSTLQSYSSNSSVVFTPSASGTYTIKVSVEDNAGQIVSKTFIVTVTAPELANESTLSSGDIKVGETVTVTGKASGGTAPYTYEYYYRRKPNTKWNTLKNQSLTPTAAAVYEIKVTAADADGAKADKILEVNVTEDENKLVNEAYLNSDTVQIKDDIRVTGAASGGNGPYTYAFYFKRSTNSKWNKIGTEFSTATYGIVVPTAAASYDIKCIVKDSEGTTETKIFTVTVLESMPLTNISLINTDTTVAVGKTVTIAGRAVGGTKPVTYEFYFKRSANTKWNKLSYGNEKQTYAKFTPTKAAEYDLKAVAIDKDGTKSEKIYNITAN